MHCLRSIHGKPVGLAVGPLHLWGPLQLTCCWWFRNPTIISWYGKYPIIYRVFVHPGWLFGISSINSISGQKRPILRGELFAVFQSHPVENLISCFAWVRRTHSTWCFCGSHEDTSWWFFTSPFETYANVKVGSSSPRFGMKIPKIFELPPTRTWLLEFFFREDSGRPGWERFPKFQTCASNKDGWEILGAKPFEVYLISTNRRLNS